MDNWQLYATLFCGGLVVLRTVIILVTWEW